MVKNRQILKEISKRILKYTPFCPTHIGNYIRSLYFWKYLKKLPVEKFTGVLDAGCGNGQYAKKMAQNFPWIRLTGMDIKMPLLEKNSLPNLFLKQGDLRTLEDREAYDFIYCIDVLEHIPGNYQVLENIFSSLKTRSYFYLHMPGRDNRRILPKKFFEEFDNWTVQEHIGEHYTLKEIEGILKSIGFNIVKARYTFTFFGKFAWELDRITDEKRIFKVLLMPLLKAFAHFDLWLPKHTGNGILILSMKP